MIFDILLKILRKMTRLGPKATLMTVFVCLHFLMGRIKVDSTTHHHHHNPPVASGLGTLQANTRLR